MEDDLCEPKRGTDPLRFTFTSLGRAWLLARLWEKWSPLLPSILKGGLTQE